MHVTVVGAGALGRIYGVRLAAGGAGVAFLVRPLRLGDARPFAIEQVSGARRHDRIDEPVRVATVPAATSAVLVTVRFDQLDEALVERLRTAPPGAPLIILTPLLPRQHQALVASLGRRIVPAMPGVSGYIDERDVVRYWVVAVVSTLLEDPGEDDPLRPTLDGLARALTTAHLPTRLERDVAALNAATTVAFFPLIAAIDAGGGIEGVLGDKDLTTGALDAAKECAALGRRLGKVASWAGLLTTFVGPYTLKPGVALARRLFPESVRFVEAHFGAKLHAQHLAMGESILELARAQGEQMPALERLMTRLSSAPRSSQSSEGSSG